MSDYIQESTTYAYVNFAELAPILFELLAEGVDFHLIVLNAKMNKTGTSSSKLRTRTSLTKAECVGSIPRISMAKREAYFPDGTCLPSWVHFQDLIWIATNVFKGWWGHEKYSPLPKWHVFDVASVSTAPRGAYVCDGLHTRIYYTHALKTEQQEEISGYYLHTLMYNLIHYLSTWIWNSGLKRAIDGQRRPQLQHQFLAQHERTSFRDSWFRGPTLRLSGAPCVPGHGVPDEKKKQTSKQTPCTSIWMIYGSYVGYEQTGSCTWTKHILKSASHDKTQRNHRICSVLPTSKFFLKTTFVDQHRKVLVSWRRLCYSPWLAIEPRLCDHQGTGYTKLHLVKWWKLLYTVWGQVRCVRRKQLAPLSKFNARTVTPGRGVIVKVIRTCNNQALVTYRQTLVNLLLQLINLSIIETWGTLQLQKETVNTLHGSAPP